MSAEVTQLVGKLALYQARAGKSKSGKHAEIRQRWPHSPLGEDGKSPQKYMTPDCLLRFSEIHNLSSVSKGSRRVLLPYQRPKDCAKSLLKNILYSHDV
jgi:hypothetical protein